MIDMRAREHRNVFLPNGMKPTRVTTDAQLIKAAPTDPEAFGELYGRHVAAVHAYWAFVFPEARSAASFTCTKRPSTSCKLAGITRLSTNHRSTPC